LGEHTAAGEPLDVKHRQNPDLLRRQLLPVVEGRVNPPVVNQTSRRASQSTGCPMSGYRPWPACTAGRGQYIPRAGLVAPLMEVIGSAKF
jgi:hypothetical protein